MPYSPPESRDAVAAEVARVLGAPPDLEKIFALGERAQQLGMAKETGYLFQYAVKVLHHFIQRRDAAMALMVESAVYNTFVKAVESERHYEEAFALWRDAMAALGRAYGAPPTAGAAGKPLGIAFVFNTGVVLGHTEVLLRLLEKRDPARERVRIYTLFGQNADFVERANALGVPVEAYGGTREGPHGWLRSRLLENAEPVAVWVTAPPAALFMLAARIAPVQVFWSLKHHPIRLPEIDGYITYGSWGEAEREFHGQRWTVCPVPLALDPRPPDAQAVKDLRARFPAAFLLGTLAREEKIESAPFLQSVVQVLERNPQCHYLWTGRTKHLGIEAHFRKAGLAARCHFVGWVDTPLYAAALDLFLETFPLGCGITGYQALGAGVPLLSYLEPNTVFGMQYWDDIMRKAGRRDAITRALLDEYPVACARSPAEYADLATRLIRDDAFRGEWLARERRFYDEEIAGVERYSRRFFDTLAGIAARKLAA